MQACGSVEECQEQQYFGGTIARMGEESYLDYAGYLYRESELEELSGNSISKGPNWGTLKILALPKKKGGGV